MQRACPTEEGSPSGGAPPTGFLTWTHNDAPMGLHLPPPTGGPLPIVMFLHGCNNDPVYPEYWIISAVNAIEPCAVFLPTAPPAIDFTCADWGATCERSTSLSSTRSEPR